MMVQRWCLLDGSTLFHWAQKLGQEPICFHRIHEKLSPTSILCSPLLWSPPGPSIFGNTPFHTLVNPLYGIRLTFTPIKHLLTIELNLNKIYS